MTLATYAPYLAISVALVLAPGPDTAVLLRSALVGGRRTGLVTAAGVFSGNMLQGTVAALGLGALLAESHVLFTVLRWVGAAYLVVLGIQALRAARRGAYAALGEVPPGGRRRAFVTGALSNLTNPKVLVMYLSVLPQFLTPGVTGVGDALLLAWTVAVLGVVWLVALTLVVHRARAWFSRRRVRRASDAVTGVALLGFGAALAVE
ncbi:LysE family translocator [Pseudonocardia endophytica]|uniref:Threonine/homoserine/homoserine lactone efflux protein n=1 Tax=Pseudonocardia endophytica TaxID=401976 RepID=A0A4R1HJJ1_PSEEN|nr:LysE family translocator [Pseudonocardia endophytica]TCK22487.1 threonine/homoserine/homoserine lactone efflux protein [Pseudonocardia endophytica]